MQWTTRSEHSTVAPAASPVNIKNILTHLEGVRLYKQKFVLHELTLEGLV